MSGNYSGRIHDPNHVLQDYDIYYNDQLVSEGYSATGELKDFIERLVTKFTVPDNVKIVGNSSFRECRNLTRVILPDGLEKIYGYSFSNCVGLEEIYIPATVNQISSSVFQGASLRKIYCGFSAGTVSNPPWGAGSDVEILYDQERPEGF